MSMTKEQEEAIEMLEDIENNTWTTKYIMSSDSKKAETVLNMLKEKDKEIEHQIEKRNNQKAELAILNEKQKEMNKLTNTVKSYKGMFKKLQKELNEENKRCMILANNDKFKEQVIDLMSEWIEKHTKYYDEDGCYCEIEKEICEKDIECKDCIKQYFERKAKK